MAGEMEAATRLLEAVASYGADAATPRTAKLATIVTGGGLPTVRFDGESTTSGKGYARLAGYTPAVGDRVVLLPVGTTYLILGAIASR